MEGFCKWHEDKANIFLHIVAFVILVYALYIRSGFWIAIAIVTACLGHVIQYYFGKKTKVKKRR